ncbi:MAG: ABC transporter substrate-binding protein [Deltaproteobacteria bacterium]|nr:ABC transporter substrate-binding protein [Deltaproteobacteria bacterium]
MKTRRTMFLLVFVLLPIFWEAPSYGLDRVRIGLSALSPTNWAVWVAEEKGFFKKHGVDAQVIYIGGGSARGVNALVSREVQFMTIGGVGVIAAALRGADLVMVASNVNISTQRLISRPEFKTAEDLRGKRVGVTAFGSNTHSVLLMVLKKWGMKPDDMVILQIGPSLTMVISLEKKFIDAAILTSPADFMAEEKGFRVLADMADMGVYSLQSTLTSTREYLRGHEDVATRFVKGYSEGIAHIKRNKAQSVDILRKKLRMDPGQEMYLDKTHARYSSKYLDKVPYVSIQGIKTLLDFQEGQSPKGRSADPESFVDNRIVRNLENSGFFAKLYE